MCVCLFGGMVSSIFMLHPNIFSSTWDRIHLGNWAGNNGRWHGWEFDLWPMHCVCESVCAWRGCSNRALIGIDSVNWCLAWKFFYTQTQHRWLQYKSHSHSCPVDYISIQLHQSAYINSVSLNRKMDTSHTVLSLLWCIFFNIHLSCTE